MDPFRKPRGDARLNQLTQGQQDRVVAHCEGVTLAEGVKWLKAQFNIKLTDICLSRWLKRQRLNVVVQARLTRIQDARDNATLMGKAIGSAAEFTNANFVLIAQAVFEELLKEEDDRDEAKLASYMTMALRAQGNDLKDRTVGLSYKRFYWDKSKTALKHAPELIRISESDADEDAKIEKAMLLLFCEKPEITDFGLGELEKARLKRAGSEPGIAPFTATEENG